FLVPRGRVWHVGVAGLAIAIAFLRPVLASPLFHSLHPGAHAAAGLFRYLPPELTMLNDLSVFTDPWREKQPYGFTGDPGGPRPGDADASSSTAWTTARGARRRSTAARASACARAAARRSCSGPSTSLPCSGSSCAWSPARAATRWTPGSAARRPRPR